MKTIRKKYVRLAALFLIIAAYLVFAALNWSSALFIAAALSLGAYFTVDWKWLRCPHCGIFINIDRLYYASRNEYHCHHCGEQIIVD